MTEAVKKQLQILKKKEYKSARIPGGVDISDLVHGYTISDPRLAACRFVTMIDAERPILFEDDKFGFNRYQELLPTYVLDDGWESTQRGIGNITPNYAAMIGSGLDKTEARIHHLMKTANPEQLIFYQSVLQHFGAIRKLCEKYRLAAQVHGCHALASALERVPSKSARTFYEACLFMKILIYFLRCGGNDHLTLGRFDQYMYPYFKQDLAAGIPSDELFETLELFFLSLNFDTDLYYGIQLGDNGQSLVLGGTDCHGTDCFNELSRLCMDASMELLLIDPKINLRCGKNTPLEIFEYATQMTKLGLGFPQYCNDDVAIPGLVALGYDYEDACNYTVAACWEFIVPNCSFDVPNITAFNFPLIIHQVILDTLPRCDTFDELMERAKAAIIAECDRIVRETHFTKKKATPLLAALVDGCPELGGDVWSGAPKYHNFGCHGVGIANAADALAAVKKLVFDENSIDRTELLDALSKNFEGYVELRNRCLHCPKMGNNDDYVDSLAGVLMETFAENLNGRPTSMGGIWRAGTGSALEYIRMSKKCPATADGRLAFTPFSSSFSPAITTRLDGPLSVIQSFTKFDMRRIINGGPLTLELHDSVFRHAENERKVAQLVKIFIEAGGHQLQLNAVNRDRLLDAQQHPENYPNLIVRVWGWSGYFCELDVAYQNHIIQRAELTL